MRLLARLDEGRAGSLRLRAWITAIRLALWLPFFVLNIVGEEFWWRGFIQPRQEPVFGRSTWLVQGLLHGLFHFSFGFGVLFLLLPVVLAIPWAVQRTRNTSVVESTRCEQQKNGRAAV